MARNTKTKFVVLILVVSWVNAQQYIENLHDSKYGTLFKDIPKNFEVKGSDANAQFQKYFEHIQEVANQENLTVLYKIKIELQKSLRHHAKKSNMKKGRSKKYNIPLKKTSMKLSNFEVWLRKMAEQTGNSKKTPNFDYHQPVTTEGVKIITTTKQIHLKFKPIISKVKTNYTKHIKPVRNKIITLTK